ncbi:uncharacterized protein LOC106737870 isoform X1 [Alligator mississippiensis]|uniref:uncharacterized protein LOC106737870 isoform X1 n=1 Tax=Alligator mississippiensis TaxID=8496 RepID=UPI0006ECAB6F|nr:uncharacterized protein LOC106737870 isoform X1 [Alligator mississippiensis]XP_014457465.1 uncharacterized protein LOC106737870 isoform X1 [Alligator mississippiensis]XP_019349962.1 uncharacterized protein LOC106737870 isoform X1 [Alligator mississippiensis]XP_019349963.1 uncharacterized protein LOC106737870 isoform X1 [Alligator mississippiensis]XP_019349964.1 uncharacterized protein LOC106737870 isoform X1 [Alligator mississippiensis]XP_019349965.1 uncharacterized protein LOC106737870 iso
MGSLPVTPLWFLFLSLQIFFALSNVVNHTSFLCGPNKVLNMTVTWCDPLCPDETFNNSVRINNTARTFLSNDRSLHLNVHQQDVTVHITNTTQLEKRIYRILIAGSKQSVERYLRMKFTAPDRAKPDISTKNITCQITNLIPDGFFPTSPESQNQARGYPVTMDAYHSNAVPEKIIGITEPGHMVAIVVIILVILGGLVLSIRCIRRKPVKWRQETENILSGRKKKVFIWEGIPPASEDC